MILLFSQCEPKTVIGSTLQSLIGRGYDAPPTVWNKRMGEAVILKFGGSTAGSADRTFNVYANEALIGTLTITNPGSSSFFGEVVIKTRQAGIDKYSLMVTGWIIAGASSMAFVPTLTENLAMEEEVEFDIKASSNDVDGEVTLEDLTVLLANV